MGAKGKKAFTGSFWSKVACASASECWPWLGYKRPSGHGSTTMNGIMVNASRKAWILTHGMIDGGLCVNHTCENALCCNPSHMYLGTRAQNMADRWKSDGATIVQQRREAHLRNSEGPGKPPHERANCRRCKSLNLR